LRSVRLASLAADAYVGISTDFRNDRNRVKPVKGSDDGLVSGDIFDDPTVRIASDPQ
jgi:hypothetical protein